MTKNGLSLLKEFEGCSLVAYQCSAGVWTIGYGSTLYANGEAVKEGDKIDMATANRLLEITVADFEKQIKLILDNLYLPEICIDSLVCFAYNVGTTAFAKSTLLKKIKADKNDLEAIGKEWFKWNKVNGKTVQGLTNRRNREFELYKQGILSQFTTKERNEIFKCNLK